MARLPLFAWTIRGNLPRSKDHLRLSTLHPQSVAGSFDSGSGYLWEKISLTARLRSG